MGIDLKKLQQQLASVKAEQDRLMRAVQILEKRIDEAARAEPVEKSEQDVTVESTITTEEKYTHGAQQVVVESTIDIVKEPIQEEKSFDWESFVGTNLMTKIAVLIMVIGLGYGVNYALEHDWLSPTLRIAGGYLLSIGMIALSFNFRTKYEQWSGVVLAGGIAAAYLLSFVAFDTYELFPRGVAFALMLLITAFGVLSAIRFKRQFIAVFGLVGAYAIPFLLSTGSGRIDILLIYIVLVNTGIVFVAFRQSWKWLDWLSLIFTWLIFYSWYAFSFDEEYTTFAFALSIVFFIQFYAAGLGRKVIRATALTRGEASRILLNSLLAFSLGVFLLKKLEVGQVGLGFYALTYAVLNLGVLAFLKQKNLLGQTVYYLVAALMFAFLALAFPLALDGAWVTLFWFSEALLLYYFGRIKRMEVLEVLSIPLYVLGVISLFQDWGQLSNTWQVDHLTVLNATFLVGSAASIGSALVYWKTRNLDIDYISSKYTGITQAFRSSLLPIFILILVIGTGFVEIQSSFGQLFRDSEVMVPTGFEDDMYHYWDESWKRWGHLWSIVYISAVLMLVYSSRIYEEMSSRQRRLGVILTSIFIFFAMGISLFELSELREDNLRPINDYFEISKASWLMRYVVLGAIGGLLFVMYRRFKEANGVNQSLKVLFYIPIIWWSSAELIHWMDVFGSARDYRMGLSILWSVIAMVMVYRGVVTQDRITRVAGIVFFLVTLLKIGLYDFAHMTGGTKAVVLIILGAALLASSYFYFRFKSKHEEHS